MSKTSKPSKPIKQSRPIKQSKPSGELATTYGGKAAHLLEGIGHVAPKIAGTAGRFAGAAGIPLMLGDFYQRGQRLSGGKVNVNQKPFLQNAIANNESIPWKSRADGGKIGMSTDNSLEYTIKNQKS